MLSRTQFGIHLSNDPREKTKGKRKKTEKGEKGLVLKTEKTWRYREKLKSLRYLQANGNFAQAEGERSASERQRVGGGILGNLPLAPGADARAGSGPFRPFVSKWKTAMAKTSGKIPTRT